MPVVIVDKDVLLSLYEEKSLRDRRSSYNEVDRAVRCQMTMILFKYHTHITYSTPTPELLTWFVV